MSTIRKMRLVFALVATAVLVGTASAIPPPTATADGKTVLPVSLLGCSGDGGRATCADYVPPPEVIPILTVRRGEFIEFTFGFQPTEVVVVAITRFAWINGSRTLAAARAKWITRFRPTQRFAWRVPATGKFAVTLGTSHATGGQASFVVRVDARN